jgi:hypothetical protein
MTRFLEYLLQIEILVMFCGLPNDDVQIARDFH